MGAIQDFTAWWKTSRIKPQFQPNTSAMPARGSQDGSLYVQSIVPSKHVLCDEGSYFITTNPVPQTVLAYGSGGTQATFSDTVPFIQWINTGNPGDPSAPVMFIDYIKLIQIGGTAPASCTDVQYAIKLDNGFRTSTSGTPVTATPLPSNMNQATIQPAGRLVYYTGAVATIPASSSNARQVARGQIKGAISTVLDNYTIAFGLVDTTPAAAYSATVAQYTERSPAFAIGPGQSATLYLWFTSGITNPFSYEFETAHWER
jgi:hypothetical protein